MATNGDILRCALRWNVAGIGDFVNVHHLQLLSQSGSPSNDNLAADILAALIDDAYDLMATSVRSTLIGVDGTFYNITDDTAWGAYGLPEFATASTGDPIAAQNAPLIVWRTSVPGRQGRTYFPALIETAIDGWGAINSGNLGALAAFATAMMSDFAGSVCTFRKVIQQAQGTQFSTIISAGVMTYVRTQRRRRSGVGA